MRDARANLLFGSITEPIAFFTFLFSSPWSLLKLLIVGFQMTSLKFKLQIDPTEILLSRCIRAAEKIRPGPVACSRLIQEDLIFYLSGISAVIMTLLSFTSHSCWSSFLLFHCKQCVIAACQWGRVWTRFTHWTATVYEFCLVTRRPEFTLRRRTAN